MAGRVKHMQRSHKTYGNGQAEFKRFSMKAISTKDQKQQRSSIMASLAGLFRHQDR